MTSRRAAIAASLGTSLASFAAVGRVIPAPYAIKRNKYALSKEFYIPRANVVTQIPFDLVRFEEGAFCNLLANGMVQVNETGLYRVCLGLDWKAQEGTDVDTRMYGIRRKVAGDTGPPALTDERLASFDHPGSDSPRAARFIGTWQPPEVPAQGRVFVDVQVLPATGVVGLRDIAHAAFDSTNQEVVGLPTSLALEVRAQVVARDTVRVIVENRSSGPVLLPAGTLTVLAQSTTLCRGESEDAWNILNTPLVELFAGERVYVIGKNQGIANDYIQPSKYSTMLQLEKFG